VPEPPSRTSHHTLFKASLDVEIENQKAPKLNSLVASNRPYIVDLYREQQRSGMQSDKHVMINSPPNAMNLLLSSFSTPVVFLNPALSIVSR
jgi:hypothetical protein